MTTPTVRVTSPDITPDWMQPGAQIIPAERADGSVEVAVIPGRRTEPIEFVTDYYKFPAELCDSPAAAPTTAVGCVTLADVLEKSSKTNTTASGVPYGNRKDLFHQEIMGANGYEE